MKNITYDAIIEKTNILLKNTKVYLQNLQTKLRIHYFKTRYLVAFIIDEPIQIYSYTD